MLNLFKKKKQVKKAATAADFNNSGIGMALKVMPFLPLALLVLSMALSALSPKGDAIVDSDDTIEIVQQNRPVKAISLDGEDWTYGDSYAQYVRIESNRLYIKFPKGERYYPRDYSYVGRYGYKRYTGIGGNPSILVGDTMMLVTFDNGQQLFIQF